MAPSRDTGFFAGRWQSFRAALNGARHTVASQPNAWIELTAIAVVTVAGIAFRVTPPEWALLALTFGAVLALEAINTAIEAIVDLVSPNYHPLAGRAKDAAAGAMVFIVLASLGVAAAIFGPRIIAIF